MKYLSEKEAESLLENFGFNVVRRAYCSRKLGIQRCLSELGLPVVMKVSGKKIVHKKKIGGVSLDVNNYAQAISEFKRLKSIKGASGVMIQPKIDFNSEFLVGIKNTPDFGHVVVFGSGGSRVEEKKDISFRVCPMEKEDVLELMSEVLISKGLSKKKKEAIVSFVLKVCNFVMKYPEIEEMDINPMVIDEKSLECVVLDARILFG